jgi:hypothetical protein
VPLFDILTGIRIRRQMAAGQWREETPRTQRIVRRAASCLG